MKCVCLDDYRKMAKDKLSKNAFNYIEGGSDDEVTKHRNQTIFLHYVMIPRILRSTSNVDLKTSIFDHNLSLPFGFAPWALGKLSHEDGEIIPATVAAKYNICYTLSILSNTHPKTIQQANQGLKFFQLYLSDNWQANKKAIKMAEEYGFSGIVITVDCQVLANRRGSLRIPLNFGELKYPILEELAISDSKTKLDRNSFLARRDLDLTWNKIKQIKSLTKLKVILKGIVNPDDAILAKDVCDAIWVSNHGGRQLDTIPTSLEVLPMIRGIVGRDFPVFSDGGIRTGMDVFKMLALGADYVFIGRPIAYSMIEGEKGVNNVVEILKDELRRTMILNGPQKISEINSSFIGHRPSL